MALPPAGYSISRGAYFTSDGQGPYAWDGANMRLLGSAGLGTFTWAALQAAYPNGGGALAALPLGVTAIATDVGKNACVVTPNTAKTRWVPLSGRHCLGRVSGSLAVPAYTWAGATGKFTWPGGDPAIPANVLAAGDYIETDAQLYKRGATATYVPRIRLGTTGTYNTDAELFATTIVSAAATNSWIWRHNQIYATGVTSNGTIWPQGQLTGGVIDNTTNFNLSAIMYPIIEVTAINAADFADMLWLGFYWCAS